MPTYPVSSPPGMTFNGPEAPSAAPQTPIDPGSFFSPEQHSLAKQIAAKRTGNPDAAPTAADYFQAKDQLQPQNEAERAASEDEQRAKLRTQQREQARIAAIWSEDDAPSSFLSSEEPPAGLAGRTSLERGLGASLEQAGPWSSITNRLAAEAAMRRLRYHRTLSAISPRYRSRSKGGL